MSNTELILAFILVPSICAAAYLYFSRPNPYLELEIELLKDKVFQAQSAAELASEALAMREHAIGEHMTTQVELKRKLTQANAEIATLTRTNKALSDILTPSREN